MCVSQFGFQIQNETSQNWSYEVFVASVFSEASIVIVISDLRLFSPFPLEKETCFFEKFA